MQEAMLHLNVLLSQLNSMVQGYLSGLVQLLCKFSYNLWSLQNVSIWCAVSFAAAWLQSAS